MAALLAGVAVTAVVTIGQQAGREDAARSRERLEMVWPALMTMPENDRALLVGLAMTCQLAQRPPLADQVIACLREAAGDPKAMVPNTIEREQAPARLEDFIKAREMRSKAQA